MLPWMLFRKHFSWQQRIFQRLPFRDGNCFAFVNEQGMLPFRSAGVQ
jgi:hypothetical protein